MSQERTFEDQARELNPTITAKGLRIQQRLRAHPDAPYWNHTAGDRLEPADIAAIREFQHALALRKPWSPGSTPAWLRTFLLERSTQVPWFRRVLPRPEYLIDDWHTIPTTARETIALTPELLVPDDADLTRLITYRTAGTTGHALIVPHDARAVGMYLAFIEQALRLYGIQLDFTRDEVACILIGNQARTVTYPTSLGVWGECGFAKINLAPHEWPEPESRARYLTAMDPMLLTGDPISFAELLSIAPAIHPSALITTAVAMNPLLKRELAARFACPVIDWYSLTETGPIGYACPQGHGFHILPHDLYVETLDVHGNPSGDSRGEITVSGGRNPFVPLLRYRTGDWGRLVFEPCSCGDPMPRLLELEGRKPVVFMASNGSTVNPVDISRVLREFPLLQHEFVQRLDRSCELTIRLIPGHQSSEVEPLAGTLAELFGEAIPIKVTIDDSLGMRQDDRKATPYVSEALLEE